MMEKSNLWSDVLGPFYDKAGLERHGIDTTDLIGLTVGNGNVVYPHAQFDKLPDGTIRPREVVLRLWNTIIAPQIEQGVIDAWTASGSLLQSVPDHPSQADQLAAGTMTVEEAEFDLRDVIRGAKQ